MPLRNVVRMKPVRTDRNPRTIYKTCEVDDVLVLEQLPVDYFPVVNCVRQVAYTLKLRMVNYAECLES